MKTHYFGNFYNPSRQMLVQYNETPLVDGSIDEDVYISVYLCRPYGFFRRLLIMVKYLFDIDTDYYHSEIVLDRHDQEYLVEVLQEKLRGQKNATSNDT